MTAARHRRIIATAIFVLMTVAVFSSASKAAPVQTGRLPGTSDKPEVRTLKFPDDKSIGALLWFRPKHSDPDAYSSYSWGDRQISGAKGLVKVTVPANTLLLLDANKQVFMNPELLKEVPAYGIDILRISAISLDDSEDGLCDQALGYVSGIKGLRGLTVDRSEATDAGLSKIKDLPRLRCISAFLSGISGTCFKTLAKLPNLEELSIPWCKLDLKNMAYLPQFPNLQILDVSKDSIDEKAAIEIGRCKKLKDLSLRGNRLFDDRCLRHFSSLKNLQYLDIAETKITVAGLKYLTGCKLKQLTLEYTLARNQQEIKALFPTCIVAFSGSDKNPNSEQKRIFGPLK